MSRTYIPVALRHLVTERADSRCEYCLVRSEDVLLPHEPDHIVAEQHGGETVFDNLALACIHCNRNKGPNIASIDPETKQLVPLFNPRQNIWNEQFTLDGAYIRPLTPIGRATIQLLKLNDPERIRVRELLIMIEHYP
jgi:hypothetical protein